MERAFAFDFDGVVLDSIGVLREVYFEFLSQHGRVGSAQEFESLNGPTLIEVVHLLKKSHQLNESPAELLQHYGAVLDETYRSSPIMEGVRECLALLQERNAFLALVTSSARSNVDEILKVLNLASMFDVVITGDSVRKSKPSPDIYRKLLDAFPQFSWFAVEDSQNGLASAIDAGLKTIYFDRRKIGTNQKVFCRVESMESLRIRLEQIFLNYCVVEQIKNISVSISSGVAHGLDKNTVRRIEEIWEKGQPGLPLHDSTVLYYAGHTTIGGTCVIHAFFGSYRLFYARTRDPELRIPFFPLAVSGVCVDEDGQLLVGKRKNATEYAGRFEFVPSGGLSAKHAGVNTVRFEEQLLDEFEEETSLKREMVASIEPLGLVVDTMSSVFDICCRVRISGRLQNGLTPSKEHYGFRLIKFDEVNLQDLIPTSKALGDLLSATLGEKRY